MFQRRHVAKAALEMPRDVLLVLAFVFLGLTFC